ncbi:MAG TPA: hypothetical protein VIC28_16970 [Thermoanaerobaculia bacterium]|jgi:hypothetical protein
MSEPKEPSAVAWDWFARIAREQEAPAREAAANRRKGAIGGVIGLTAALAVFLFDRPVAAAVIAGIAVLIFLIAMASPLGLYKTLTHGLDRFAHAVGSGVTWLLMTILYYVVFLPIGALMRRKLAISRGADPRLPTYWTSTEGRERTPESYRKQF